MLLKLDFLDHIPCVTVPGKTQPHHRFAFSFFEALFLGGVVDEIIHQTPCAGTSQLVKNSDWMVFQQIRLLCFLVEWVKMDQDGLFCYIRFSCRFLPTTSIYSIIQRFSNCTGADQGER